MPLIASIIAAFGLVIVGGVILSMNHAVQNTTLRRNDLVGIRTSQTMKSDRAWQVAHEAALTPMRITAYLSFACAALTVLIGAFAHSEVLIVVAMGLSYVAPLAALAWACRVAHRAAAAVQ